MGAPPAARNITTTDHEGDSALCMPAHQATCCKNLLCGCAAMRVTFVVVHVATCSSREHMLQFADARIKPGAATGKAGFRGAVVQLHRAECGSVLDGQRTHLTLQIGIPRVLHSRPYINSNPIVHYTVSAAAHPQSKSQAADHHIQLSSFTCVRMCISPYCGGTVLSSPRCARCARTRCSQARWNCEGWLKEKKGRGLEAAAGRRSLAPELLPGTSHGRAAAELVKNCGRRRRTYVFEKAGSVSVQSGRVHSCGKVLRTCTTILLHGTSWLATSSLR
jgi:hypothetical protein